MASKKYTALCICEILKEHSDQNHPLSQKEIINLLESTYGIEIKRKSIGSIINEMMEDDVFANYDIQKVSKKGGVYLGQRIVEPEEMTFIKDALFSSKSLTEKQAKDIIKKLSNEFSKHERVSYECLHKYTAINRTGNKNVLNTIDTINEAIINKKKITFQYCKYNLDGTVREKTHIVSPYFFANTEGMYYLVSYSDEHKTDLTHFKVGLIQNVTILEEKQIPLLTIKKNFNISKYIKARPHMFSGKEINAKLKLLNDDSLNRVVDGFGQIKPYCVDGNHYVDLKEINETALIYWCLQYCDYVELVEPSDTRNKIKEKITDTYTRYK